MSNEELEQSGAKPEEFEAVETGVEQPEEITSKERTRESEIQANIDFWKNNGVEVDDQEIKAAIEAVPEVAGFEWYIAIPKGVKFPEIWQKMGEKYHTYSNDIPINSIEIDRESDETYAVAARYSQEPDNDANGGGVETKNTPFKSVINWSDERDTDYMTPTEWIVANMRWSMENNEENLFDGEFQTIFPGADTDRHGSYNLVIGKMGNGSISLGQQFRSYGLRKTGVRRVVTKDTSPETIDRYLEQNKE